MLVYTGKEKETSKHQRKAKQQEYKHVKKQHNQERWLKIKPFEKIEKTKTENGETFIPVTSS